MVASASAWQRLLARFRRSIRAFESERTDDTSTWRFRVRLERDELDGGWTAECVDLPGCFSEGETQEAALTNLADAIGQVVAVRMTSHIPDLGDNDDAQDDREFALSL
ncbi:MAG: type II toxin-antitoxin system HicB family antitoxin [Jatrophihabitans sp.]